MNTLQSPALYAPAETWEAWLKALLDLPQQDAHVATQVTEARRVLGILSAISGGNEAVRKQEQAAFDAWRGQLHAERLTGWLIWCGALKHRGFSDVAAQASRPSFDAWRSVACHHDWQEIDAWCAAVAWAAR